MRKHLFLAIPIVFLLCFYACTHKPETPTPIVVKDTTVTTVITNTTTPTDTTTEISDTSLCFQRDVLPIFLGSCAMSGCHDAITVADGYNLSSWSGIISKGVARGFSAGSKLYTTLVNKKMPRSPIPLLDSTQLSLIKNWIDRGANNDSNCATICDTTKYTYATAIAPILKSYCYSCHSAAPAASSGGGIILDNYNSLLVQVQNGKLIGDLEHSSGYNYMPLGGIQLSACKITQFKKWITDGALNN